MVRKRLILTKMLSPVKAGPIPHVNEIQEYMENITCPTRQKTRAYTTVPEAPERLHAAGIWNFKANQTRTPDHNVFQDPGEAGHLQHVRL